MAFIGLAIAGVLVSLAFAIVVRDCGKVFDAIGTILLWLGRIALEVLGFWTLLAIGSRLFTAWAFVWELIIGLTFIGYAFYQLVASRCI